MYIVLPIAQYKHLAQIWCHLQQELDPPYIKNWFTFINFKLLNQSIVKSQAAMTVNFDKSEPKHARVKTNLIGQCNIVTPFLV